MPKQTTEIKKALKRFDQIFKGTVMWREHRSFLEQELSSAVQAERGALIELLENVTPQDHTTRKLITYYVEVDVC